MSEKRPDLDPHALGLADWDDLADTGWEGLLVGNGASIVVSPTFSYSSLFDVACTEGFLEKVDANLFEGFDTVNFEQILYSLRTAARVSDIMGADTEPVASAYERIAEALGKSAHSAHVEWGYLGRRLDRICAAIRPYDWVFSTNYDLLLYWAAQLDRYVFRDYFFNPAGIFDRFDVEVAGPATRLLFLHGGLHLWRLEDDRTMKRKREETDSLLSLVTTPPAGHPGAVPLAITEGTAEGKLRAISRSDYLTFAFDEFQSSGGPLAVFGLAFGETDSHLVSAINEWGDGREIAISEKAAGKTKRDIEERAKQLDALFPRSVVTLYAAETHPLGDPSLRIPGFAREDSAASAAAGATTSAPTR